MWENNLKPSNANQSKFLLIFGLKPSSEYQYIIN